jgi:hypothetical protein
LIAVQKIAGWEKLMTLVLTERSVNVNLESVRGNNAGSTPYKLLEKILTASRSRIAALFLRYFLRQTASFPASARPRSG